MVPNQRNIELVAIGSKANALKLVLDSDGKTEWALTNKKAPVRIVRGVPGDAFYWSSDVIKWSSELNLVPIVTPAAGKAGFYKAPIEDKWSIKDINSVVDGNNPARELNFRVWPVGLSSIDWQRLINTGHFLELTATLPAIKVATEFAEMLDSSYKNQREHGSGGLHAYAVSGVAGTIVITGGLTKDSDTFVTPAGPVVGDYIKGAGGATYRIVEMFAGDLSGRIATPAILTETAKHITKTAAEGTDASPVKAGLTVEATPNKFVPGQYNWEKTRLQVTTSGMGGATYNTQAFEGVGTWQQIAEREWFAKGNEGKPMRTNNMAPYNPPYYEAPWMEAATPSDSQFNVYNLRFSHDMLEPLGQPNNSPKSVFIAEVGVALHAKLKSFVIQA